MKALTTIIYILLAAYCQSSMMVAGIALKIVQTTKPGLMAESEIRA